MIGSMKNFPLFSGEIEFFVVILLRKIGNKGLKTNRRLSSLVFAGGCRTLLGGYRCAFSF